MEGFLKEGLHEQNLKGSNLPWEIDAFFSLFFARTHASPMVAPKKDVRKMAGSAEKSDVSMCHGPTTRKIWPRWAHAQHHEVKLGQTELSFRSFPGRSDSVRQRKLR